MLGTQTSPPKITGSVQITAVDQSGRTKSAEISPEKSLVIGSAQSCGMRLDGDEIGGLHCLVYLEDGQLRIQDWYSTSGTSVNGQKVTESDVIRPGDQIRIGDFVLTIKAGSSGSGGATPVQPQSNTSSKPESPPSASIFANIAKPNDLEDETAPAGPSSFDTLVEERNGQATEARSPAISDSHQSSGSSSDEPTSAPDSAPVIHEQSTSHLGGNEHFSDNEPGLNLDPNSSEQGGDCSQASAQLEQELTDLRAKYEFATQQIQEFRGFESEMTAKSQEHQTEVESLKTQLADARVDQSRSRIDPSIDPFDSEMLELLKSEVEQLQNEVAARDARLEEFEVLASSGPTSSEGITDDDVTQLEQRLEALLEELGKSDARITELETMLQVSEESVTAEKEERSQLESWLSDVEDRVEVREQEWQGANEALERRIQQISDERDEVESALRNAASGQITQVQQKNLDEARNQIIELEQKLGEAESERISLQRELDKTDPELIEKEIERRLREEKLQLATERADVARQKSEGESDNTFAPKPPDEINERIRALREHLDEIHEKETKEKEENSLAARLGRLWKRLDS